MSQENYSGQKKKVNGLEGAKYFFPIERGKFPGCQKELSHYYKENLIYKSRAVNFLFLTTVCHRFTILLLYR